MPENPVRHLLDNASGAERQALVSRELQARGANIRDGHAAIVFDTHGQAVDAAARLTDEGYDPAVRKAGNWIVEVEWEANICEDCGFNAASTSGLATHRRTHG